MKKIDMMVQLSYVKEPKFLYSDMKKLSVKELESLLLKHRKK